MRLSPPMARQQGQALVLGLVLLGVLALAFLRYFQAGQMVAAKSRQLHALDAASYSAALVQAKVMNLLSYLNRAQAGHQVAMAHLTALGAWAMFGQTQAGQLLQGNPPVHLIGMQFGIKYGQAYASSRALAGQGRMLHDALMQAHQAHDRKVHQVLQALQTQLVVALPAARMQALRQVLERNYGVAALPEGTRLEIRNDGWPGYLARQSGTRLLPFLDELAGLYAFLSPRNETRKNPWPVSSRCPWRRHELRRRGDTRLDASGHWQSQDTLSFHALRSNRWIGCYFREYSMAWAWIPESGGTADDIEHVEDPPEDFSEQDFWRWVQERTDWNIFSGSNNPLANSRAVAARTVWSGMGLGFHYDVSTAHRRRELRFDTYLGMPGRGGQIVHASSAARTFFSLPPAARSLDTAQALPQHHLFHPYWQAVLASPSGEGGMP